MVARCLILVLVLVSVICSANIFAQVDPKKDELTRLEATKLVLESQILLAKNTPESREEAFPKATKALKMLKQVGDDEGQIKSLSVLNQISFYRSDFRKCIEYSSQILVFAKKTNNKNLQGGTMGNLGYYHSNVGENQKGLEYLNKSAEILNQLGEKRSEAIALSNIGLLYYSLGEIKKSLEYLARSLALRRESDDKAGEAIDLTNLGFIYNSGGNNQKALEYYKQAIEISIETKDQVTQATILNNIGSLHQDQSKFQKALDYYNKSLEIRRKIDNKYGEAVSLQNISSLYRTFGEFETALDFIKQSLAIYQSKGFKREEALALTGIGSIHIAKGDKTKALEFYEKGLKVQESLDDKIGYSNILGKIGRHYLENKDYNKSLEYFEKGLKSAEESKDAIEIADMLVFLGRNYAKIGKSGLAETNFKRALSLQRETVLPFDTANTLYHYARFQDSIGKRDLAIEKINEVLQIIENLRSSIASEKLRAKFLGEQQKYYDFYISMLVSQHKANPKKGFDKLALQASEKARGRSMLDTLGEMSRNIRTQTPPELLEEERLLRQTINAKDSQRIKALKQKSIEKAAQYEKELKENLRKYQELQTKIRRISPQFASLSNPEPLKFEEIQSKVLDNDSVLLEYFLGEERSFLFFVTKQKLEIFELPKRELVETSVRKTVENLKARTKFVPNETFKQRTSRIKQTDSTAEKYLEELGQTLISPVADKIKNKRLLIVSTGVLQYLPFAALKNPSKSKSKNVKLSLIETNEIVNLPSASVVPFLREAKKRKAKSGNSIAILADPVFSSKDKRLRIASTSKAKDSEEINNEITASNLRSSLSRLRFSRREAEAISKLLPENQRFVALDFAANLNVVNSKNFQQSRIVHLATHGIVNSQIPELSSIVFSLVNEEGKSQEGYLRLFDIYNLKLNADLVVLSACDGALGKEIKGEGLIGLTRGFMYAGAETVVASYWQVEDRATAEFMTKFYRAMLKDGLKPAAALRLTQIETIKENRWKNPYYWASFTLQGEWKQ